MNIDTVIYRNIKKLMLLIIDSYRSFAVLRMITKRKRVILNEVKNLYESSVNDIIIGKMRCYTNLNLNICQIASGFFVMARRRFAGLLAASQGPTTKSWRKRHRKMVKV